MARQQRSKRKLAKGNNNQEQLSKHGSPPAKHNRADSPNDSEETTNDVRKLSQLIRGLANNYGRGPVKHALISVATQLQEHGCTFKALETMDDVCREALLMTLTRNAAVVPIISSAFKNHKEQNSYSLGTASVSIAYDDDVRSPHPLPDTLDSVGDKLVVTNYEKNSRDEEFNPLDKLVLTSGAVELLKYFWDHMDKDKKSANNIQELCIGGASGIGKSCAVRLLVGDIIRRKPSWDVYYIRDYNNVVHKNELARRLGRVTEKTYLVVDQIKTSEDAQSLGSFASNPSISVILVSSANVPYFRERRAGIQHSKKVFDFRFSSSFGDCMYLRSVLLETKFESQETPPEPQMTALTRDNLRRPKLESLSMFDKFRFVNGNFLLMAELFFKRKTPIDDKLEYIGDLMSDFFQKHPTLYLAVVEMFQHLGHEGYDVARVQMDGAGKRRHLDYRHISPAGIIRAPIYLRAFHSVVRYGKPPTELWESAAIGDLRSNPSIEGFVLERECLQSDRLTHVARRCVALFKFWEGKPEAFRDEKLNALFQKPPFRFCFDDVNDLCNQLSDNKLLVSNRRSWAAHAIPDAWNYTAVDGILIYFLSDTTGSNPQHHLFVIGNQITTKPLHQHAESLAWLAGEARHLVNKLLDNEAPSLSVHVALLFTCKVVEKADVATSHDLRPDSKVLQYPIEAAVSDTCRKRYFGNWQASVVVATTRLVTITKKVEKVGPTLGVEALLVKLKSGMHLIVGQCPDSALHFREFDMKGPKRQRTKQHWTQSKRKLNKTDVALTVETFKMEVHASKKSNLPLTVFKQWADLQKMLTAVPNAMN